MDIKIKILRTSISQLVVLFIAKIITALAKTKSQPIKVHLVSIIYTVLLMTR
jgi:hypothetical protein